MSLLPIVRAFGGYVYDGGRRANIPYPGHSRRDRSLSLLYDRGRVIAHCFGGGGWPEALDHLRQAGLLDGDDRPISATPGASGRIDPGPVSPTERVAAVSRLWECGCSIHGTPAEAHARLRHVRRALPGEDAFRFGRETPLSAYRPGTAGRTRPALLAAIRDADGHLTALEITYLRPNGRRADEMGLPRKTIGRLPGGSAVRLDPAAPELLVAEGVFTTLSATERFSLPGWALLSTSNLRRWSAPDGVRFVLIAGDNDADGRRSAGLLAERLTAGGVRTRIEFPDARHKDWNDGAAGG